MDRKNPIVPKNVESEPYVSESPFKEAVDGMSQQLVVLTAEVFDVKTALSNGVDCLQNLEKEPLLSTKEFIHDQNIMRDIIVQDNKREHAKTRLMIAMLFMVLVVLMFLGPIREALMQPKRPPSFWDTMLPYMIDFRTRSSSRPCGATSISYAIFTKSLSHVIY